MPTSFTSYYGSSFHGMDIEWKHDPTAATKELEVKMKLNWYSPKVYIDARVGGRIDMSTTTVRAAKASKVSKAYKLH